MPSILKRKTIETVARLSRIHLMPEEEERLLADFEEILATFSKIDEAKTDCDPAFHPIEIEDIFREDREEIKIDPDEILEQMTTLGRFIRGPRMQ